MHPKSHGNHPGADVEQSLPNRLDPDDHSKHQHRAKSPAYEGRLIVNSQKYGAYILMHLLGSTYLQHVRK
jgi:hypothetical protein